MFSSKKAGPRELLGWCLFDFANSAFATVIVTVVYSVYFMNVVAAGRPDAPLLWSIGTFISYGFVFLVSPLLGAMADYSAGKKHFLFASYLACVLFTILLFFVEQGDILAGLALFILANIAFSIGENFISSFLPEIAAPEEMGRVSGYGWAIGYFGGVFSLVLCYPFISTGLDAAHADRIRWVYPITAAFFALAGIPTFLWLRSRRRRSRFLPATPTSESDSGASSPPCAYLNGTPSWPSFWWFSWSLTAARLPASFLLPSTPNRKEASAPRN